VTVSVASALTMALDRERGAGKRTDSSSFLLPAYKSVTPVVDNFEERVFAVDSHPKPQTRARSNADVPIPAVRTRRQSRSRQERPGIDDNVWFKLYLFMNTTIYHA
jgi:hypothetical protein